MKSCVAPYYPVCLMLHFFLFFAIPKIWSPRAGGPKSYAETLKFFVCKNWWEICFFFGPSPYKTVYTGGKNFFQKKLFFLDSQKNLGRHDAYTEEKFVSPKV